MIRLSNSGIARSVALAAAILPSLAAGIGASHASDGAAIPNVLIVTVDTLRADRMSSYGYARETTPRLDRLIASGARFSEARTNEPLTAPALCAMITGQPPHRHGSSRNGLRMRNGLASLPKSLQAMGYRTSAFVGNWTLRDKLSGLAEHFETYEEVLNRARWFGLLRSEATAEDLTERAGAWIADHVATRPDEPFFSWIHYVEPHAPYRLQKGFLGQLGLQGQKNLSASDRYDTEVAFVDAWIGKLLDRIDRLDIREDTLIVFASDHGESLGEHDYWGHGRNLHEPNLRIPMAVAWPGRIAPGVIEAPALITDIAPTILGLLEQKSPASFDGYDWTGVFAKRVEPPMDRVTYYQAHRGAVISRHDSDLARKSGLLSVGIIDRNRKEIFRVQKGRHRIFDLTEDPGEIENLSAGDGAPTEALEDWMRAVYDGLSSFEDAPPLPLDEESVEKLRSLGYVE